MDGSWAWLDNGMTVAAAADGTPVPAVLKRTGHLSRMDNRVTTQTNGGYVVVQRSTYALAGSRRLRCGWWRLGRTHEQWSLLYVQRPSFGKSSGQALGGASAIQKDGSTEGGAGAIPAFWRLAHGAGQPADEPRLYRPHAQQPGRRG
ncbi:MAG: hypothetical protein M5U34_35315 [Chloroflexi bacterium]|nr:hypothetical protein [Chloroflexota bacterium]